MFQDVTKNQSWQQKHVLGKALERLQHLTSFPKGNKILRELHTIATSFNNDGNLFLNFNIYIFMNIFYIIMVFYTKIVIKTSCVS